MDNNLENNNFNNEQPKFGLPEGYFQKSASSIFNKIEWEEEHKIYIQLLQLKNRSGFSVPENYFGLSETKLELIGFEKLASHKKNNPFIIPQNYFETDGLQLATLSGVEESSELNNYKTLASLEKKNNFSVNENYFIENEEKLKTLLIAKPAKVINLFSAKMWYSVAALLVIALGFWMYNSYYKIAPVEDCGTLACVDKIDLVKAKHLENIETEELYNLVNTKKLEDNLEKKSTQKQDKENADTSLKSVSADELLDEL